jgi:methionyl-tRNA synthetase
VQETAPWNLARERRDAELDAALGSLVATAARLAALVQPFMPAKADALWTALGSARSLAEVRLADLATLSVADQRVSAAPILFPKPAATP